jgi:hypothetical protein
MLNGWLPMPLRLLAAAAGLMLTVPVGWTEVAGLATGGALLLWQRQRFPAEQPA